MPVFYEDEIISQSIKKKYNFAGASNFKASACEASFILSGLGEFSMKSISRFPQIFLSSR